MQNAKGYPILFQVLSPVQYKPSIFFRCLKLLHNHKRKHALHSFIQSSFLPTPPQTSANLTLNAFCTFPLPTTSPNLLSTIPSFSFRSLHRPNASINSLGVRQCFWISSALSPVRPWAVTVFSDRSVDSCWNWVMEREVVKWGSEERKGKGGQT